MCEFNKYVIYACICIHTCIHIYAIYSYTFILHLQWQGQNGHFWETRRCFFRFTEPDRFSVTLSPPLAGRDIAGMPLVAGAGRAGSLPAVRGWRRRQQLSAGDTEPTAPSRRAHRTSSLVLAEVCGWCCLTGLKMTVPDHLK